VIVVVDNYDSFTYNLVQFFGSRKCDVKVFRNDEVTPADVARLNPSHVVISPGPGSPENARISCDVIRELGDRVPLLGICLGFQCIAHVFGARIIRADAPVHGKTSPISHDGKGVFAGLASPFEAMRYHSLVMDSNTFPSCLTLSAWTEDRIPMGLRHSAWQHLEGVQFHPESILTDAGGMLLDNFLACGKRLPP